MRGARSESKAAQSVRIIFGQLDLVHARSASCAAFSLPSCSATCASSCLSMQILISSSPRAAGATRSAAHESANAAHRGLADAGSKALGFKLLDPMHVDVVGRVALRDGGG